MIILEKLKNNIMKKKGIKVELGVIDEAKAGMKIVLDAYNNPIWNSLEKLPNMAVQIIAEAKQVLLQASKGQTQAILNARKVSEMAKELGMPVPKEIEDIFKNNDYDDLLNAFQKDLDKIIANVKQYS